MEWGGMVRGRPLRGGGGGGGGDRTGLGRGRGWKRAFDGAVQCSAERLGDINLPGSGACVCFAIGGLNIVVTVTRAALGCNR